MAISVKLAVVLLLIPTMVTTGVNGISINEATLVRAQKKLSGLMIFGDSTMDSGNNDYIPTLFRSNFAPYGMNFFNHTPNGRFTDGRLPTDFLVEYFDISNYVPAYLDPSPKAQYIMHEKHIVSFASAGSGYDPFTSLLALVSPFSTQMDQFKQYKQTMIQRLGDENAQKVMDNALCLISTGTNDLVMNYMGNPFSISRFQYTQEGYESYMVSLMRQYVEEMHYQGCKRIAVSGLSAIGCLPYVKLITLTGANSCSDAYNKAAMSINAKIQEELKDFSISRDVKTAYLDTYRPMWDAIQNPKKYGFKETRKGCCGTGIFELGPLCKDSPTCSNPKQYVFWDAVHPTQAMYKLFAEFGIRSIDDEFFD
ncbi:GDSL esterase/lipase-like protein [Drosera capensis]